MKKLLITAACVALTGCAGMQQAVQAYGGVVVTNAKAANDTLIEAYKTGICSLPLSALARHPEIIPAVRSLCLHPSDRISNELLNAVERHIARAAP